MGTTPPIISIVSPVYFGAELVDPLISRISLAMQNLGLTYEILLVEDGSQDDSWSRIDAAATGNNQIKGIKLTRNFGQHSAISAGLQHAQGDFVVVIDCDLQDDPAYISQMYAKAREGFDVVYTKRSSRAHSGMKNTLARAFNATFNWLSDSEHVGSYGDVGSFSMLSRKAVHSFCQIKDYHRHYLLILRWLGFNSTFIEVQHSPRFAGKSTYSFRRLLQHAIDGITSQSTKLLRLSIGIGFIFCALAVISAFALVFAYIIYGFREGWTSIIVLILLCTGVNLLSIGVIGLYVGKTFEQVKERPLYLIDKTINLSK